MGFRDQSCDRDFIRKGDLMKRKGYLIFTTHDGDELDARFVTDEKLFKAFNNCKDNDEAIDVWDKWIDKNEVNEKDEWYVMTLGRTITEWNFNDIEVLGTYYFEVY
jgi:hypothetical protein